MGWWLGSGRRARVGEIHASAAPATPVQDSAKRPPAPVSATLDLDGAQGIASPQLVSQVLLVVIALLLALRFWSPRTHTARRLRMRARSLLHKVREPRRPPHVDFAAARESLKLRFGRMVGLDDVKAHMSSLLDTLEIDHRRRLARSGGYVADRGCMHMVFLGCPGTGKTAVAHIVGTLMREMGVLRRGHLVVAKKADLLGRYSNHVARNTSAVVKSALGGVLLVDEAYALLQGEPELGRECISVLVDLAYTHRDDLVVILAGYTNSMSKLFSANAGLPSRFPNKFAFPDYSVDELLQIGQLKLEELGFSLRDDEALDALRQMVMHVTCELPCGNARSVENRIAAAISAQSSRLLSQGTPVEPAKLFELVAADFIYATAVCNRAASVQSCITRTETSVSGSSDHALDFMHNY